MGSDTLRIAAVALAVLALPFGVATAQAARPIFPNMAHVVGDDPAAVATADLDHDGVRDLVVANRWSEDLSILRGLGGGDFAAEVRVPAGGIPVALAIADFNRDGRDDIAAALPVIDRVAIYLTGADGLPGAPTLLVAGDSPGGLLAADLDRDGGTDLVAANFFSDTLTIWRGLGDGTFAAASTIAAGPRPVAVIATLLNGDLAGDLVVANSIGFYSGGGRLSVLLGDASGGYGAPVPYLVRNGGARNLVAADVDGDGAVDLVHGTFDNDDAEANFVGFLPGRGDGSFGEDVDISRSGDGDLALGVGDFDHDGRPDLAYGAHHGGSCCDQRGGTIALGHGDGTFTRTSLFRSGRGVTALVVDDLDADGVADIAALSNVVWGEVTINLGRGDGFMGLEPARVDQTAPAVSKVALGDVDGDGRLDVVASLGGGQVSVWRGLGLGQFASGTTLQAGSFPWTLAVRDLDGDAMDEVTVLDRASDSLAMFRSIGGGMFASPLNLLAGEHLRSVTAGDLTGDGIADLLAVSDAAGGRLFLLSRPGQPGATMQVLAAGVDVARSAAVGDFDGDGLPDIAALGNGLTLLRGVGPGLFAAPVMVSGLVDQLGSLKAGDLDGDGRDDLVVGAGDTSGVRVFLGRSDGTLEFANLIGHQSRPTELDLADLDADGRLDLVTIDETFENADVSVALQPLGVTGTVQRRIMAQANSGALAAGDVDGDGRVDLVVPGWGSGVAMILNQGPFPNHAPRALPAATTTVECTGPGGASVTLDGSGSTDPDSTSAGGDDIATYEWFEDFDTPGQRLVATGALATATLSLGGHDLTLRVTDRAGAADAANLIVEVVDTVAPVAGAAMLPARLWPPNHEYSNVRANVSAIDACGPVTITLVSAKSSEPDDIVGGGDGSTLNDIAGAAVGTAGLDLRLRAERDGLGTGRTYTLVYRVVDGSGNATDATAEVFVPVSPAGRGGIGAPSQGGGAANGGSNGNGAPGGNGNGGGNGQPRGPRPRPDSKKL